MNPLSPQRSAQACECLTDSDRCAAAKLVYEHLALTLPPDLNHVADAVIGFGHFDLRIAERCIQIRKQGLARLVIFTGGVGAGSADLKQPEADAFREAVLRTNPEFPCDELLVENRSTNTGDNVRFTAAQLLKTRPDFAFGTGIRSVILVATPSRMRRVWLTFRAIFGDIQVGCMPPQSDLATDCALFRSKGQDLITQLPGEVERLVTYPNRGWILAEPVPNTVIEASRLIAANCKL
jgi:uncharacterized SAM-binding protein YcdF (DUF218 family)